MDLNATKFFWVLLQKKYRFYPSTLISVKNILQGIYVCNTFEFCTVWNSFWWMKNMKELLPVDSDYIRFFFCVCVWSWKRTINSAYITYDRERLELLNKIREFHMHIWESFKARTVREISLTHKFFSNLLKNVNKIIKTTSSILFVV